MIEERILDAVERIDGAMSRIEAVANRPPPLAAENPAELTTLRERHVALRMRVEAAVAELDTVMREGRLPESAGRG